MDSSLQQKTRQLQNLIQKIRLNLLLGQIRRWAKLICGAILLIGMGYLGATLISQLSPDRWYGLVWWVCFVIVVGVVFYSAWIIKESLYGEAAMGQKWDEIEGPLSMSLAFYPMPDWDMMSSANGPVIARMQVAAIAEIILFPASWMVQTIREWKFLRMIGPMDAERGAALILQLNLADHGMALADLKLNGDQDVQLLKTIAHLRLLNLVDRSDKRDRIWLPSRVRDLLKRP